MTATTLEILAQALISPAAASRRARREQPLVAFGAVLLLAVVSEALASLLVARATHGGSSGVGFLLWLCAVDLTGIGATILVGALFLPFAAVHLAGGRGSPGPLVWALAFSWSPWMLWSGLGLILQMLPWAAALWAIAHLVLGIWILLLQVRAVAEVYRLSMLRAVFTLAVGYGMAGVLLVVASGLGFVGLVNAIVLWTA